MLKSSLPIWSITPVLALALLLSTGCSSSTKNIDTAGKTVNSMDSFTENLDVAKQQIDATIDSMQAIKDAPDRVTAYKTFVGEINKMEKVAARARRNAIGMRKHGERYFSTWLENAEKISSPELRKISEERRESLNESFGKIGKAAEAAKDSYDPFMEALYDIQLYLSNDLTDAGVEAVGSFQDTAATNSEGVKEALTAIQDELVVVRQLLALPASQ